MASTPITIRVIDEIRKKLELVPFGTANPNQQINKALDRYLILIEGEKTEIRKLFETDLNQLSKICEKEKFIPAETVKEKLLTICDANKDLLSSGLWEKINGLKQVQIFALVEIIEELIFRNRKSANVSSTGIIR